MKKVLLSNRGAEKIRTLRDDADSFTLEKYEIADAMCGLTDMMAFGLDSNDVTSFTNSIFNAMRIISNYNEIVNSLNETMDYQEAKYGLIRQAASSREIEDEMT